MVVIAMQKPIIILNYKTYLESSGDPGRRLTWAARDVMKETGVRIIVCPQTAELYHHRGYDIEVFSQHVDPIGPGSHTGHVLPESLRFCGVTGSLVNHSEDRRPLEEIGKCVEILRSHGMVSVVCAESIAKVREVSRFRPDFVAIEPPELIGSGIPVSKADPGIVRDSVAAVTEPGVRVLCGAGISRGEDVKAALGLGTVGVLLASGVVKAKDPKAALRDLAAF